MDGEEVVLYGVKDTLPEDYAFVHEMKFEQTPFEDDSMDPYVRPSDKPEPQPQPEPQPVPVKLKGDTTGDGDLNVSDLAKLAAHVKGIRSIKGDDALFNADINNDGDINVTDLTLLAAHVKGIRAIPGLEY